MDVAAFVLVTLAITLGALYIGFRGVAWLFLEMSGWHALERQWGCEPDARVWTHRGETVQVNAIRFRRCAGAGVQTDALYLRIASIFRSRALRIPWGGMTGFEPVTVYGRAGMRFRVSGAAISVDAPLYACMYLHLAGVPR